jgi:hypothetical protein
MNDACRIRDSIVDHNYCHDTLGSQGGSRAGFQVKVDIVLLLFLSKNFCVRRVAHTMSEFVTMFVTKQLVPVLLFTMIMIVDEI